ncbi:MAG: HD domain-containing phosphohydrolase [Pseudomonadota bacterium]
MSDSVMLTMDQLRVGLYIYLDMKWFDQPFAFGDFRIKSEEQIRVIRSLGLPRIRYNPELSNAVPGPALGLQDKPATPAPAPEIAAALEAKNAMIKRIGRQRAATARVTEAFVQTAKSIHAIDQNLFARPEESVRQANVLVGQIASSILSEAELAIHVMGETGSEEMYFHSLNVTILSMMMARDLKLPPPIVIALGMGALFHDVGKRNIPDRLQREMEAFTPAERTLFELHTVYGQDIAKRLQLSLPVQAILLEHHEHVDGSGFPAKLKGDAIGLLSRIVAIANTYDELCNPVNIADALTPHEALAHMFAKLRAKFDARILQIFIRSLGVYPPGSIVELSNGVLGMVTTVNTSNPMKPMLMIYDGNVPKEEAILVDMEHESDVSIVKAVRPAQVAPDVYRYLNPRKRVSYYFDPGAPQKPR